jgi:hypothetical protein
MLRLKLELSGGALSGPVWTLSIGQMFRVAWNNKIFSPHKIIRRKCTFLFIYLIYREIFIYLKQCSGAIAGKELYQFCGARAADADNYDIELNMTNVIKYTVTTSSLSLVSTILLKNSVKQWKYPIFLKILYIYSVQHVARR